MKTLILKLIDYELVLPINEDLSFQKISLVPENTSEEINLETFINMLDYPEYVKEDIPEDTFFVINYSNDSGLHNAKVILNEIVSNNAKSIGL